MPRSRSPLKSLAATLDRSGALVALFDEERRLIYASKACGVWLGIDEQLLVGREGVYSSEPQADHLDSALARLTPPPHAFLGQQAESVIAIAGLNAVKQRRIRFLPLLIAGSAHAVLAIGEASDEADEANRQPPRSEWHAALARMRTQLPINLHSEYLVGESPAMRKLREQVQLAARSTSRVVVYGPRGAGTQEIAARIHALSGGRNEGLLSLNSPLQDAETLQAAVRAISRKRTGKERPSLLLRDVGLLPRGGQQELLGFLQLPGFEVRVIATSRVSLSRLVEKSKFLPELAALLTTLEIRVPQLARRSQDVPLIAQGFVERAGQKLGKPLSGLVPEALEQLLAYPWPENVDELGQSINEACSSALGPWIIAADLPERLRSNWQNLAHPRREVETINLDAFLASVEQDLLTRALAQTGGNKSEAARLLSISRPRLLRRLVQLGLAPKEDVAVEEAIDFQVVDGDAPVGDPL